jgi:hypothetical protein
MSIRASCNLWAFLVRLAANSSLATHALEPRVSLIELTRLAPMQVTHGGIPEVGDEAIKPSDWRGCIKAGNYELAVHRWSRVWSYTSAA